MGDKIYLQLKCAWCKTLNPNQKEVGDFPFDEYICYAPSCGDTTFKCWKCGKENEIVESYIAKKQYKRSELKLNNNMNLIDILSGKKTYLIAIAGGVVFTLTCLGFLTPEVAATIYTLLGITAVATIRAAINK